MSLLFLGREKYDRSDSRLDLVEQPGTQQQQAMLTGYVEAWLTYTPFNVLPPQL